MRIFLRLGFLAALLIATAGLRAQETTEIQSRLVGHPLYLRGMWADNWLEFNGDGTLHGKSAVVSLTMSAVDVDSVTAESDTKLLIHAHRDIIGWSADGILERVPVTAKSTIINEFGRRLDTFSGKFEMKILVHADKSGSFDSALHAVFADGLQDMAASAPKYWACWATGYFVEHPDLKTAQQTVDDCIEKKSLAHAIRHGVQGPDFVPPKLVGEVELPSAEEGFRRHATGSDEVAFTVSSHGIAVGFQIRRAFGYGIDEAVLDGLARAKFLPASDGGKPVVADMDYMADLTDLSK